MAEVISIQKSVQHNNGDSWELDNYPPFAQTDNAEEWLGVSEISLERAKELAFQLSDEAYDYEDEINNAEDLYELQDALDNLKYYQRDNTYNSSWWGGVVDFGVLTEDGEGYGTGLVLLRMHRGGDPRGNYYEMKAFELDSFIEEFPPYFGRLSYYIKTDEGDLTLDSEDMEGYSLLVVEDETGTFEQDDYVKIDEVEDAFDMNGNSFFSFGGGVAVGSLIGAYIGYKVGRARGKRNGGTFDTEKKIGRSIKGVFTKKKFDGGGGVYSSNGVIIDYYNGYDINIYPKLNEYWVNDEIKFNSMEDAKNYIDNGEMENEKYDGGGGVNSGLNYGKKDDVFIEVITLLNSKLEKPTFMGKQTNTKQVMSVDSFMEFIKKYEYDERYEVNVPIELFTKESFNQYNSDNSKLKFITGSISLLGKEDLLKKYIRNKESLLSNRLTYKEIEKINDRSSIKNAPEKTTIVKRIVSKQLLENGGGVEIETISMSRLLSEFRNEKEIFDDKIVTRGSNQFKIENDVFYIKRPNENWEMFRKIVNKKKFDGGGGVGEELMGGQPNSSKPSGYTLVKSKGREIIVTDDGGKTQERWIKSNGYSGYTLRYNGNQYEFTDSFARGGMTEHGLKEGDTIIGENGYQKDEVYVLDRNRNAHYVNLDKGQRFGNGGGVDDYFTMKDGSKMSKVEWYKKMEDKLGFEKLAERILKDSQFGQKINTPSNELTHNRLNIKAVIGKKYVTISSYTPNYNRYLDSKTFDNLKELDDYLNENQILAKGGYTYQGGEIEKSIWEKNGFTDVKRDFPKEWELVEWSLNGHSLSFIGKMYFQKGSGFMFIEKENGEIFEPKGSHKLFWRKINEQAKGGSTYQGGGGVEDEIKTKYQIAGSNSSGVYTYSKRVADEIASKYGGEVQEDGSKWYVRLEEKYINGGGIDDLIKG